MPLDNELLDVLACPKCNGTLEYREADDQLVCHRCRLIFAVRDNIPIMLLDEARSF